MRGELLPSYEDTGWTRNGAGLKDNPRYKFDDLKKATYVRLIRQGVRRVRAAEYVGVTYATVMEHFQRFPEFLADVNEAEMARVDEVEEALFESAIQGNVIAQQVVLYNRRSDEWADQRMRNARLESANDGAAQDAELQAAQAAAQLRGKLLELRERLHDDTAAAAAKVREEAMAFNETAKVDGDSDASA